jgi:hypothetical protein
MEWNPVRSVLTTSLNAGAARRCRNLGEFAANCARRLGKF